LKKLKLKRALHLKQKKTYGCEINIKWIRNEEYERKLSENPPKLDKRSRMHEKKNSKRALKRRFAAVAFCSVAQSFHLFLRILFGKW